MPLFTDSVSSALERAMDGVALRQRVISQNISNSMTPGYQAQKVDFESALSSALSNGDDLASFTPQATPTGAASRTDGNNVEMDTETSSLMQSGLQFDALVQAANYKNSVMRSAVRG